jgi:hypothetical protein
MFSRTCETILKIHLHYPKGLKLLMSWLLGMTHPLCLVSELSSKPNLKHEHRWSREYVCTNNEIFFAYIGGWTQGLCLLGRHSTTWVTPLALLTFVILEIVSRFLPGLAWTMILFMLPCIAGWQACTTVHSQWLRWGGSHKCFTWTSSKMQISLSLPPK